LQVEPPPLLEVPPLLLPLLLEAPPLLLPLLLDVPPLLLPPPPPAQLTGAHSAGTASGVHPGSLVCAWTHEYVVPLYVTSWPVAYATHAAHGVAVAHCAALKAS